MIKTRITLLFIAIVFLCSAVVFIGYRSVENDDVVTADLEIGRSVGDATTSKHSILDSIVLDAKFSEKYGVLPINFEPNVGQADESVKFTARGSGYALFLTEGNARIELRGKGGKRTTVDMSLVGSKPATEIKGIGEKGSKTNYLIGDDPTKWHTDIPNYSSVTYTDVYEGIDAVYYGNGRQLEYDFVVAPKSDPKQIALRFDGANKLSVDDKSGDLIITTDSGELRQLKPFVYQNIDGVRNEVASSYRLKTIADKEVVSIELSAYDLDRELVIDPILSYGGFLGGSGFEEGRGIAVDSSGNAYVSGTTASLNFPVTPGTIKTSNPRSTNNVQWNDAFVTKINEAGTAMVWSTYFGGRNGSESGTDVAVTTDGEVIISGTTTSNDLPTLNAYQSTFGGTDDSYAAKLNANGSAIIYSTYLGGNNTDIGGRIAVDNLTGDAVIAGFSSSPNFPTTPGAFKSKLCDTPASCSGVFYSGSYAVRLTASGTVVYSTLFDAGISDVVLDAAGNAVFGGSVGTLSFPTTAGAYQPSSSGGTEGFIAKLDPTGSTVVYATYLGGGQQSDRISGITLDQAGNIYATGQTQNAAFPVTAGAFDGTYNGGEDGFVTKLDAAGANLVYSTFIGGSGKDQPFVIGLAPDNSVIIAGETLSSSTFPLRNSLIGNIGSIFVTRFNTNASELTYSTLLGVGGAYGLSVDGSGNAFVTGHTTNVVVTPNSFQPVRGSIDGSSSAKDAFVIKLEAGDEAATSYSISGTVIDENLGSGTTTAPIVITLTGTVNRSYSPQNSGGSSTSFIFGNLPAGGNYTVTATRAGFVSDPESIVFTNLGANQFADFRILRNAPPEGTITTPVHGTTFNAPATISIQATASDPDGDAIQKVDFVAYNSTTGNIPLGTDTTAPYEFTWTNVPVGTYALSAIPTDSKGLRGVSIQTTHVFVVDPTTVAVSFVSPTEGQTFVEGDYVPIQVAVSSSVSLVQVRDQNNNLVAWLNGSPWSSTWRVFDIGTYTLTATASDSQGNSAVSQPVTITIGPIDHQISGKILDNITNQPLAGVTLDLTSPSDPTITAQTTTDTNGNYIFSGLGTTPNDSVRITPTFAGYTFAPTERAIGYLGYITWPNQNFTAIGTSDISVSITSPTNGETFIAPASFTIAADASSTSGTITKVDFYSIGINSTLIGTDTTAPYEMPISGLAAGNYGYFARATDSNGGVADSDPIGVRVDPAVSLIRLQGEVHNPGGGPMVGITVRMTGMVNGTPIERTSISNTNGSYGFFNLAVGGDYTIAPESPGLTFTPASIVIENAQHDEFDLNFVSSAQNQAPSVQINSPTDGAVFAMPNSIPINVTASDIDGTVAHLKVSAQSSTMFTTIGEANNGLLSFNWQPNLPGSYILWAEARDNGGLRTTISITITVQQPAPVSISGRIVDRNSEGIDGVTVELKNWPADDTVIASAVTDSSGNYSIADVMTFQSYVLRASKEGYSFSPQKRTFFNLASAQNAADFTGTAQTQVSDFDGDGVSDIAVWRPSTGVWWVSRSFDKGFGAVQFGGAEFGDKVTPGNYDGDKKIDYAVYRNGTWYIMNSSSGSVTVEQFGTSEDRPVPADYDGDGITDIAIFRPSTGQWWIKGSSRGLTVESFGLESDVMRPGDFDGDGKADLAAWRPRTGVWYVMQSTNSSMTAMQFGISGDIPLSGDFDGDKRADMTVLRPANGVWYIHRSSDEVVKYVQWGVEHDIPVPGDYDRDGKTDVAVFRESEGNWYIVRSATETHSVIRFGLADDVPIPAANLP